MKKAKLSFIVLLVGLVIVPQVTFAAWWNPLSWPVWSVFKKSDAPVVVQVETISTSTPSVSTSTETKKDVAPETQKKTTAVITQPKTEPVVQSSTSSITQEQKDVMVKDLVSKFHRVDGSLKLKNTDIADLKEMKSNFVNNKYGDFDFALRVIDDTIAFIEDEKLLNQFFLKNLGEIDTTDIENRYNGFLFAYDQWLLLDLEYSEGLNTRIKFIEQFINDGRELAIARANQEAIDEVFAPYKNVDVSKSLSEIQAEREKIAKGIDDFLKNLSETQAKLQGKDTETKEKREEKLRRAVYMMMTSTSKLPQ